MMRKCLAIILSMLALHCAAQVQTPRKGVALTLSGGGAKGLYHIGVIRALEENDIPIDFISGTSMGAIVAGLYAAGYSPVEMEAIVESGGVAEWVSGRPGLRYEPLYRQKPVNAAWVSLPLNVREHHAKFEMPSQLISSSQIDLALIELFSSADVASGGDFDSLMVPFRCVAADMAARRPVIMSAGRLGESIRASMSIPLAFRPVENGQMLLYDGGIYNNFPWQTLDSEFSPEVFIGSICTAGNARPDADSSILRQAIMLVMNDTDYSMPEGRSVTVERAVPVGMLDFDRATEIIAMGYADAMERMPQIRQTVAGRRSQAEVDQRRREFRARAAELRFGRYEVTGLTPDQTEYVERRLNAGRRRDTLAGSNMSFDRFRRNYVGMLAEGDLNVGFPRVSFDDSTKLYSVSMPMRTRPRLALSLGGNISSTAFNEAYVGLGYSTIGRVAQLLLADLYVGPVYSMGQVGGRTTFFARKPLMVNYSYNFSVLNSTKGSFGNITTVDNTRKMRRVENFLSLGIGTPTGVKSMVSFAVNGGSASYRYYEGVDENRGSTSRTRFVYVAPRLSYERNTFDRRQFPRRGVRLAFEAGYVYGSDRYLQSPIYLDHLFHPGQSPASISVVEAARHWGTARLEWESYSDIPSCRWFSMGFQLEAVVTNHPDFHNSESTVATAPHYAPIAHSKMIYMPAFHADKFVGAGVMPTFDIIPDMMLRAGVYAMFRERFAPDESRLHYIADLSLIYHTRLGPVSLSMTKYDFDSSANLYLTVNFGFTLFGKKGFTN